MSKSKLKELLADCAEAWRAWSETKKTTDRLQAETATAGRRYRAELKNGERALSKFNNARQAMTEHYATLATLGQKYPCGCVEGGCWCDRHGYTSVFSAGGAEVRKSDPRWNGEWLGDVQMRELKEALIRARDLADFLRELECHRAGEESERYAWERVRRELGDENKRLEIENVKLRKGGLDGLKVRLVRTDGKTENEELAAENVKLTRDLAACHLRRLEAEEEINGKKER